MYSTNHRCPCRQGRSPNECGRPATCSGRILVAESFLAILLPPPNQARPQWPSPQRAAARQTRTDRKLRALGLETPTREPTTFPISDDGGRRLGPRRLPPRRSPNAVQQAASPDSPILYIHCAGYWFKLRHPAVWTSYARLALRCRLDYFIHRGCTFLNPGARMSSKEAELKPAV